MGGEPVLESSGHRPSSRLATYYRSADVRARLADYCAGSSEVAGFGGVRRLKQPEGAPVPTRRCRVEALLDEGAGRRGGGVCAGVAAWAGWHPSVVRVAYFLLTAFAGFLPGAIAYLVLWLALPQES